MSLKYSRGIFPITNGREYTVYMDTEDLGTPSIPLATDESGQSVVTYERWSNGGEEEDDGFVCDCCGQLNEDRERLLVYTYPAIVRCRSREPPMPAVFVDPRVADGQTGIVFVYQAFCNLDVTLCDNCHRRAECLRQTSDHVAVGYDWWDMVDSLAVTLQDPSWFDYKQLPVYKTAFEHFNIVRIAATNGRSCQTTLADIPPEVFDQMMPAEVVLSVEREAATRIQALWRGFKTRKTIVAAMRRSFWNESSLDCYRAAMRQNPDAECVCRDCGTLRTISQMDCTHIVLPPEAPGQPAGRQLAHKWVCCNPCRYICQHCDRVNYVAQSQKPISTTLATKQCRVCSNVMTYTVFQGTQ